MQKLTSEQRRCKHTQVRRAFVWVDGPQGRGNAWDPRGERECESCGLKGHPDLPGIPTYGDLGGFVDGLKFKADDPGGMHPRPSKRDVPMLLKHATAKRAEFIRHGRFDGFTASDVVADWSADGCETYQLACQWQAVIEECERWLAAREDFVQGVMLEVAS